MRSGGGAHHADLSRKRCGFGIGDRSIAQVAKDLDLTETALCD